jgi:tripartite-type tricarboxylate transporter receptor subunit TctC
MNVSRRRLFAIAIAFLAGAVVLVPVGSGAWAQTGRTIRIIVPYPAGGGIDVVARLFARQISAAHGVTMVVEDRPGASTIIGTDFVSRAAADGNTLLLVANSFVVAPHLRKVNYDALTSFEPVCNLVATPSVLAVNNASPFRTLADLVDAARAQPNKLTIASSIGAALHVTYEMLRMRANFSMTFVSFPGTVPAVTALLGGHVDAVYSDYPTVLPQLRSGAVWALATGSRTRMETFPDVPTIDESGYKGFEADIWYGLFAPAGTPPDVTARLAQWFTAGLSDAEVKARLATEGLRPVGQCGRPFADQVRKDYDEFGRVIRAANIKAE